MERHGAVVAGLYAGQVAWAFATLASSPWQTLLPAFLVTPGIQDPHSPTNAIHTVPPCPQSWIKALGKPMKRKGKRLFMPVRIALTGSQAGPDVGQALRLLTLEDGDLASDVAIVRLDDRIAALQTWLDAHP